MVITITRSLRRYPGIGLDPAFTDYNKGVDYKTYDVTLSPFGK
jgi:hypothetical protein